MQEIFNIIITVVAFILAGFFSGKAYRNKRDTDNSRSSGNSDIDNRSAEYDKRITELEQRASDTVNKLQQKISKAKKMDNTNSCE